MVIDVCSTTKSIVNRIGKSTHVTSFFNDKKGYEQHIYILKIFFTGDEFSNH